MTPPIQYGFNRFQMGSVSTFAESVRYGESLGFDMAWIPSSPLLSRDPYVMLAQAAQSTSTIHLGPMLENPITRHPAAMASSIATIAELSGGRAEFAIGVGDTAVRTIGRSPAKVKTLEQAVDIMRTLLAGEKYNFGDRESRLRHASPVPVWVAAGGPRTLNMAGRMADGAIIRVGTHPDNIDHAIQQVNEGAVAAGRNPSDIRFAAVFHTVLDDDEAIVGKIGRAIAAGYYEYAPYLLERIGDEWNGPDVEELKQQIWQDFHHTPDLIAAGELLPFLTDKTVDDFCLHGTTDQVREQIETIVTRYPQISMVVPHPMTAEPPRRDQAVHVDFMERFAEGVIRPQRQ